MQNRVFVGLLLLSLLAFSSVTLLAQQKFTPPNVKEGLWEMTMTHSGSGMPGMPADALAKMPPEQRAQVEAMMKARGMSMSGNTTVVKSCVTKEKMDKGMAFAGDKQHGNCTPTIVSSSPSHMEIKMHCEDTNNGKKTTMDATTVVDVVGQDSVKGSTHGVMKSEDHSTNMDLTFTSKYLGPNCGDIK
jgi:hypothetical protein